MIGEWKKRFETYSVINVLQTTAKSDTRLDIDEEWNVG